MENHQINNQRIMDQIKQTKDQVRQTKDRIKQRTQKIEKLIANNEEVIFRTNEDGTKENIWVDNADDLKNK
jgi:hypothetical protein